MAYTAKTPEQIIREAAAAAKELLPGAEAEKEAAEKALGEAHSKIARYMAVISAAEATPEANISLSSTAVTTGTSTLVLTNPSSGASAFHKVATVISKGDGYTARQISDQYERTFKEPIPQSTLYNVLKKGREGGQFTEIDSLWTLTKRST